MLPKIDVVNIILVVPVSNTKNVHKRKSGM